MESSLVTHGDIRAAAVAFAVAYVSASLARGVSASDTASALPSVVESAEEEWTSEHLEWNHDRSGRHVVSSGLAVILESLNDDLRTIRERISVLARPHLDERFTVAHPNQGFALLGGIHALCVALHPEADPSRDLSDMIRQGYDTDTVGAIAGGLMGARFGDDWIPVERLVDREHLSAWANWLSGSGQAPETVGELLCREARYTTETGAFPPDA
jgi:ADP-ribosylglycohydrolase